MARTRRRRKDPEETADMESVGRMERLRERVGRVRGSRGFDPDRLLLALGAILIVGGLVAIVIGWWGAANTGFPFEQTPYLISGGLLGVALVFLGGFVYFAYWVTRLIRESRTQSDRASDLLDRIAETLDGAAIGNGSNPRGRSSVRTGAFVATRSGTQFHRPECPVVAGRSGLRRVSATARGMTPCRICDPLEA
ncbi:MAG: hypothetical protein WD646_08225 [Actinomycetota bacterium]